MLVEGAWEPSAGPPTTFEAEARTGIKHAVPRRAATRCRSRDAREPLCKCVCRWHANGAPAKP